MDVLQFKPLKDIQRGLQEGPVHKDLELEQKGDRIESLTIYVCRLSITF
jgi:hypothetical protein